jgi:phosphoketolase
MHDTPNPNLSAFGPARATITETPLSADELRLIDAYWRTTLYLSVGMIYLRDNPLLLVPLKLPRKDCSAFGVPIPA